MTIKIMYYTNESKIIKNITAVEFDGENGELKVIGDNGKFVTYRLVKEVNIYG